jgi:hypothetical protein
MHGSLLVKRLESLGRMLAEQTEELETWEMALKRPGTNNKREVRKWRSECKANIDALTFALDVINDLIPSEVAYEAWGAKLLELSLHHTEAADGSLLVYASLADYLACEVPPHEPLIHVMRIKTETPLGRHEPRTAFNANWNDCIAGMECGYFGIIETVAAKPVALLTAGTEVTP